MNTDEELPKKKPVVPVTGAGAVAVQKAKAPVEPPKPQDFVSGERTAAVARGLRDDVADSWKRGEYGEALGRGVRGGAALFPAAFVDAAADVAHYGAPLWRQAAGVGRGVFGMEKRQDSAAPTAPAAQPASVAASVAASDASASKEAVAASSPAAPVADASVPTTTQPAAREVAKGVYEHGRGQFSDSPDGLGLRFTGKPNVQNMRAVDALAERSQQASIARVRGAQQQGPSAARVSAPSVAHSGNDWRAQMDLRNARARADSVASEARMRGWGPRRTAAMLQYDPRILEYRALLERDNAARGVQPQAAMQAMAHNAQNQRQAMGLNVDVQRLGLAQQQHDLEAQKAAGAIESQAQLQQLQKQFMLEEDPKKKEALSQLIDRLWGKGSSAQRYMRIGGGQMVDPKTMEKINAPDRVIDLETQQEMFF